MKEIPALTCGFMHLTPTIGTKPHIYIVFDYCKAPLALKVIQLNEKSSSSEQTRLSPRLNRGTFR